MHRLTDPLFDACVCVPPLLPSQRAKDKACRLRTELTPSTNMRVSRRSLARPHFSVARPTVFALVRRCNLYGFCPAPLHWRCPLVALPETDRSLICRAGTAFDTSWSSFYADFCTLSFVGTCFFCRHYLAVVECFLVYFDVLLS